MAKHDGLLLLALAMVSPVAADTAIQLRAIPEFHQARSDSPFVASNALTSFGADRSRQEVEVRSEWQGINAVVTARSMAQQGRKPDNELLVNECYYDGILFGQRYSVGKKILSWDVGFGFRPLDVIQQEDRRAVFATTLEGVPYLAWERFDGDSAWLLVLANPGRSKAGKAKNDESLALKFYRRDTATDWHGLLRTSRRNGLEAGAAFAHVADAGLEWHGSLLHQTRYEHLWNPLADGGSPLAAIDPLIIRRHRHGTRALIGATWTGESGISIVGEAWYDSTAYRTAEWRAVTDLAHRQAALRGIAPDSAVDGNLAFSTGLFTQPNLLRKNLLMRLSHRQEGNNLQPALDLLYTPEDGGRVDTASLSHEGNRYRIDAGVRVYGGQSGSAYRLLPEGRIVFLALQINY